MRIFVLIGIMILTFSCKNEDGSASENLSGDTHKIVVEEVLTTSNYTYLFGDVDGEKNWIAVTKFNAKVGDIYYYDGGMLMQNFVSKELNRTFENIYFVDAIRSTAEKAKTENTTEVPHNMKPKVDKQEVDISVPEGGISVGELFSKRAEYEGKVVLIKGVVAKFNPQIMDRNWIHIQDGTDFDGEFDLTVTSKETVKVGDTVTVEGKIALKKDFGFGYSYEVIMEDAVIK